MDIVIPNSFLEMPSASGEFRVHNAFEAEFLSGNELVQKIEDIAEISCSGRDPISQDNIDTMYSMIAGFSKLPSEKKSTLLSAITDLCSRMLMAVSSDELNINGKNSIKIVEYFLLQLAIKGEAYAKSATATPTNGSAGSTLELDDEDEDHPPVVTKKGKGSKAGAAGRKGKGHQSATSFDWCRWRISCLELLERCLLPESLAVWSMGIVAENFLTGVWKYALQLLEEKPMGVSGSGSSEVAAREMCMLLVSKSVRLFGSAKSTGSYSSLTSALVDSLTKYEHMSVAIAELMSSVSANSGVSGKLLISELMTEIANMNMATVSSVKNIGLFIECFAKQSPAQMATYLPVLKPQIDSAAHQIRSSLITAMAHVIIFIGKAVSSTTPTSTEDEALSSITLAADDFSTVDSKKEKVKKSKKMTTGGKKRRVVSDDESSQDDEDEDDADEVSEDLENDAEDNKGASDSNKTTTGDGNQRVAQNKEQLSRLRDSLLGLIFERTHDKSPYTRSNVLKVWSLLLEDGAIPVRKVAAIAGVGHDRLVDKTAAVRKNAIALLTSLLENNPFGSSLDLLEFSRAKLQLEAAIVSRVKELQLQLRPHLQLPGEGRHMLPTIAEEATTDEVIEDEAELMRKATVEVELDEFMASEEVVEDSELKALRINLEFTSLAVDFLTKIEKSIPVIETLLSSKTNGDVVEALKFFTRAVNFGVQASAKSLRRAFSLIWHQDVAVKNECLAAFCAVYLTDGAVVGQPRELSPAEMAENLVRLCQRCQESEVASLEKIIGEIFKQASSGVKSAGTGTSTNGSLVSAESQAAQEKMLGMMKYFPIDFDIQVMQALWATVASHHAKRINEASILATDLTIENSIDVAEKAKNLEYASLHLAAALRVIGMITKFSPQLMTAQRMRLVVQVAFNSPDKSLEFPVLRAASTCLQSSLPYITLSNDADSCDERVAEYKNALLSAAPGLRDVLLGAFCGDSEELTRSWFSCCEEAMHALFHVHPCPDKVFASIVAPMYQTLTTDGRINTGACHRAGRSSNKIGCKPARLARLLFLLGQGAICSLVYVERIAGLAKKAKDLAALTTKKTNAKLLNSTIDSQSDASPPGQLQPSKEAEQGADAMEQEMGLAASADAEHEMIYNAVVEKQLVLNNLLSKFVPLVSFVVANQKKTFSHYLLRETAILTLCRLMSISSSLCEQYLPLLFTVLDNETSEVVRTTTLIALADLAFRFPNALEPWNAHMYARLSDKSSLVRYNTLTVLTHLVLNDMIKVKGQVTNIVLCLSDPSQQIRDLAVLFFTKLSDRSNNPVYNLLGDIIANLSVDKPSNNESGSNMDDNSVPIPVSSAMDDGASVPFEDSNVAVAFVESAVITPHRSLSKSEFQSTMTFLLSFIKKDKQADALLERLVMRLGMATTTRQRRYLSFCISQLSITDKGVKKMMDLAKHIKIALYDDEVYGHIYGVVHRVKKAVKVSSEIKSAVDEFEALLASIRCDAEGRPAVVIDETANDDEAEDGEPSNAVSKKESEAVDEEANVQLSKRSGKAAKTKKTTAKDTKKSGSKKPTGAKSKRRVVSDSEEDDHYSTPEEEDADDVDDIGDDDVQETENVLKGKKSAAGAVAGKKKAASVTKSVDGSVSTSSRPRRPLAAVN